MTKIEKWGDSQQYHAEPHEVEEGSGGVQPKVTLLTMTERPLSVLAAFCAMYEGRVVRDLGEMKEEDMIRALDDVQKTHLQAPLEAIKLHFLIEGVDRAFTHQLVRQRTAVYAQESLRFAVVGDLFSATTLPPSLAETSPTTDRQTILERGLNNLLSDGEFGKLSAEDRQRAVWDYVIGVVGAGYDYLANSSGMPAEEARGLLPHATATRLHYITDLRNLKEHAGNRLCTQAQFHWRSVFLQIVDQVRNFGDGWQYKALADSALFRPVCYQLGRCPFQASFDRECIIRSRVEAFARAGVPSSQWQTDEWMTAEENGLSAINPAEWALLPDAARA